MAERVQKIIAASGMCSRRTAEEWIRKGRVAVNGKRAELGIRVEENDVVTVDGRRIPGRAGKVWVMLNKPVGYVSTLSDEKGRRTVRELVADVGVRVYPVGRLDMMSEGLLLLTNDGELAERVQHPRYGTEKRYRVSVYGGGSETAELLKGVREIDGEAIRPVEVELIRSRGKAAEVEVVLREGKNRQIRRMCERCGLTVRRLCRVGEHTLELGTLRAGEWRYLTEEEVRSLRQAGG